ncbi:MAG: hypothetical protein ACKVTZ_13295 [Bacteroidia bacterium]
MKHLHFIALSVLCSVAVAQSEKELKKHRETVEKSWEKGTVEWSMDTLFNKGAPYCLMYKEKEHALLPPDFTVAALDGTEHIFVKYDTYDKPNVPENDPNKKQGFYTYNFLNSGRKVETPITGFSMTDVVGKMIVKAALFKEGVLDEDAEHKFGMGYGTKITEKYKDQVKIAAGGGGNQGGGNGNNLVERDRDGMIIASGNSIRQSNVLVGKYSESTEMNGAKMIKVMQVSSPNGQAVATARSTDIMGKTWIITTAKDNQSHTVSVSTSDVTYWKCIANFLIQRFYL